MSAAEAAEPDVLIIGAGFAGLAMAYALLARGIGGFRIVDRAEGPGGVWRANAYPRAACDVPSHLYSFSFRPNPDWTRKYSPRAEILAYLEACAAEPEIAARLSVHRSVAALAFDPEAGRWRVRFADGSQMRPRVVVSAVGQLAEPALPELDDAESFTGPKIHTALWPEGLDLAGRRVAVIGNAASAVQLVPELARVCAEVSVIQRTPNWVMAKPDRAFTRLERTLFRRLPFWLTLYRRASFLLHESRFPALIAGSLPALYTRWSLTRRLAREIPDPGLRASLTPDYPPGCKRVLLSNDYLASLRRPNVRLVASRAVALAPGAVVTATGERVAADAVVFATGFHATDFLASLEVRGLDGRTLADVWGGAPQAYRGVAQAGFPNLFMLYGPNTNLGHNSIVFMLERQAAYAAQRIARLLDDDLTALDVRPEAQKAFNAALQARLARTVWAADCPSWYKTADGRITNNWSGLATAFAMTLARDDRDAWIAQRRGSSQALARSSAESDSCNTGEKSWKS